MKTQRIALDKLRTDGGTQAREEISNDTVREYAAACEAGDTFPPIDVFYDGTTYWIAEGFHRFYGHRDAKKTDIECVIHQGTQREAILFSVGTNRTNGLRRTNADKRRAVLVMLEDDEWVLWADNRIAKQAGVSSEFVGNVRRELSTVESSLSAKTADAPKLGKDGKKRKPRSGGSRKKKATKPAGCPKGGDHERDMSGTCTKCCDPPEVPKADRTSFDVVAIEAEQAAEQKSLSTGETVKASGLLKLTGAALAKLKG